MTSVNKLLLLLTACFTVCMAAPCHAGTTRGEVLLEGASITLGDIFLNAGDKANLVVAEAPAPGKKTVFDINALMRITKTAGFEWKPDGNYERVTVTRDSQSINAAMIKDLVVKELAKIAPSKEFDVALDNRNVEVFRAKNEPLNYHLTEVKYDAVENRFDTMLVVEKSNGDNAEIIKVPGRAMPIVEVAMLRHSVNVGDAFSEDDVDWAKIPSDKAGADAVMRGAHIDHSEAKHSMNSGSILRSRDIRGLRLVTKGMLVNITVETPLMSISAQGRAASDGAMGDTVQVINTQSNRTIDAVVTGSGKVSVMPESSPAKVAAR